MLDTTKNIKEANDIWDEIDKELGITEEKVMSSEYDYIDED